MDGLYKADDCMGKRAGSATITERQVHMRVKLGGRNMVWARVLEYGVVNDLPRIFYQACAQHDAAV